MDTECVTRKGWKRWDEIDPGADETVAYNPATARSEWTPILDVVTSDDAEVYVIGNSRWEMRSTADHWWLSESLRHGGREPARRWLRELRNIGNETKIITSVTDGAHGKLDISSTEAEVLGWVWGDGSVSREGRQCKIVIYQSKPAMIARLRLLLAAVPHNEQKPRAIGWGADRPTHVFYLHRAYGMALLERAGLHDKHATSEDLQRFVLGLSPEARSAFLRGLVDAEGSVHGNMVAIYQNEGPLLDAIVLVAQLCGYRPRIRRRTGARKHECAVSLCKPVVQRRRATMTSVGHEPVWCVRTGLGTWTMRQGDHVSITGSRERLENRSS